MQFGSWVGDETVKVLDQRRCSDHILRIHDIMNGLFVCLGDYCTYSSPQIEQLVD